MPLVRRIALVAGSGAETDFRAVPKISCWNSSNASAAPPSSASTVRRHRSRRTKARVNCATSSITSSGIWRTRSFANERQLGTPQTVFTTAWTTSLTANYAIIPAALRRMMTQAEIVDLPFTRSEEAPAVKAGASIGHTLGAQTEWFLCLTLPPVVRVESFSDVAHASSI